MPFASEIASVASGIWVWQSYDPTVKADLFSTAVATLGGTWLIDPIPLAREALAELQLPFPIRGIVVTNENHERAAGSFARELQVSVYLHPTLLNQMIPGALAFKDDGSFAPGLVAIEVEGAPKGEVAIYSERDGGTFIIGDALINFEPYGFAFLPSRYCSNPKAMRRALVKLLDYPFDRMLFAHGTPILSGARRHLEALLRNP